MILYLAVNFKPFKLTDIAARPGECYTKSILFTAARKPKIDFVRENYHQLCGETWWFGKYWWHNYYVRQFWKCVWEILVKLWLQKKLTKLNFIPGAKVVVSVGWHLESDSLPDQKVITNMDKINKPSSGYVTRWIGNKSSHLTNERLTGWSRW